MIGTNLGRYRILGPLGKGGMGEVFLAEDPALGRKLAIKVLPPAFAQDPERRARLLHEARAASALNHPNIVTVHDLGDEEGALFIAMERIDGETLREWARAAPRSPREILRLIRQTTQALAEAHAAGLVHRDLKPENLMVRRDGLIKILDFGLARSAAPTASAQTATLPGTVMGTTPYMSPEQVLGQTAGSASDLFSIGTILYELLTGTHPFAAGSAVETMHRILHENPEPPSRMNRALSTDFDFVLLKVLSKDPRRRHSSARDLDVDLETLDCGCEPAAGTLPAEGAARAIAVLPFKNIGGDPELHYLGVGLADAVITRLSNSPDLIVRTTSSILPYQDQPTDPRRVAQELDATAVLDASFQRAGDRFRATARLVESASGKPLWAGKVDVRFDDIFEVQDRVAHGIAEALTARLSAAPGSDRKEFTPSPEAYRHLMRGDEAFRVFTEDALHDAIREYERAVEVDPGYARAWIALGQAYHGMVDGGFRAETSWYEREERALDRARQLDPSDPLLSFRAGAQHLVRGRKREAYRELVAAMERMPNSSIVHHYFGYLFRISDMLEEAFEADSKALELDPNVPWTYAGLSRIETLRSGTEAALTWIDKARQRLGPSQRLQLLELAVYTLTGESTRAGACWEAIRRQGPLERDAFLYLPAILLAGDRETAEQLADLAEAYAHVDMDGAGNFAAYCAHMGNRDLAFQSLDRAVELGGDMLRLYERTALWAPLHGDPRWGPFLDRVRARVARWRAEFRWPPA